ncbi:MAG: NHL repeat-containing protein [Candidatus Zixiibacteriota bacterium]
MSKYSVFFLLLIISCSHPKKELFQATLPISKPVTLLIEKEIAGSVFGNRLKQPFGLAIDFKGYIYISDAGNNRLVRFNSDFSSDREIGGYGSSPGLFDRPSFISFDNGLNLMVSDEGNRRLTRYNSQLNFVDELIFNDIDDPLKFGYPSGIAFTKYGEVWIADREKNRVAVFDNIGRFDQFLGDFGYPGGQLNSPEKIIKDSDDNFIVCDAGNARLVYYDSFGNFIKEIKNKLFVYPISVTEYNGNLWVLDGSNGRIYSLDKKGNILFEIGPNFPGSSKGLKEPSDIIFLPDRTLLISDTGNNRLLVLSIIYEEN